MNKILIDIERMKYPNNGLFHYCAQLVNAIGHQSDVCKEDLTLMAPPNVRDFYRRQNYNVYNLNPLHKFYLPLKNRYDIWHCTYQNSRYFPFTFRGKIVYTIHDFNFMYKENYTDEKKKNILKHLQKMVDKADVIVAISNFVRSEIIRFCRIDPEKIQVIYNGCNIQEDASIYPPEVKPSRPFFFTIGTVLEKKNFKVLPSMLLKNDFQLIIAGDTSDTNYCQKIWDMAKRLNVVHRVKLIGCITEGEKNWFLKNCLGFAFPSLTEGFGLPVLEAMHYGKPTFLSTFTALPEIGGDEAYYFENFEPEYMANKTMQDLDDFANNANKAQQISDRAGLFTWKGAAKKYNELYKKLLK